MRALFFLILLLRASAEPLFEALKADNGAGMGAGAILNALVIMIAAYCLLRQPVLLRRVVLPMWGPFLLAALVAAALAPEPLNALRLFLVQVSYCAVFATPLYLVRTQRDVKTCVHVILCSSLLPVAYALLELGMHGSLSSSDDFRIKSTFTHPNIFAFYLVLMVALILYVQKSLSADGRRARLVAAPMRATLWIYMASLLALLILTRTRSAWGACLLVFMGYGMFFQRRFLLYALAVPLLLLLDPGVRERLLDVASNKGSSGDTLNSYAWRVVLWQAGLEWMQGAHALFGYGLDSFKFYSPRFFPLEGQDSWDPHNVYVQLLFETGLAGLFSYAWLLTRLLRRLRHGMAADRPGSVILMSIVLAYMLTAYFDNMLYYLAFNWYFWFLAGSACAALRVQGRARLRAHAIAQGTAYAFAGAAAPAVGSAP